MTLRSFATTLFIGSVGALVLVACGVHPVDDSATSESEVADISNCDDARAVSNASVLESQGFTPAGTTTYEVLYYQFGSNHYWKNVRAFRYEKGASVRYATCKGIVASPIEPSNITLDGKYFEYTCSYPCSPQTYGWMYPSAGKATVTPKAFVLDSQGAAMLTVHVTARVAPRSPNEPLRKIDEDVILSQSGSSWSNRQRIVSLQIQAGKITGATITTRPSRYDPYDPGGARLYNRSQFQFADPSATPDAGVKTVTLVELPDASGVRVDPPSLAFSPAEGRQVRLLNKTSSPVRYEPSLGTPGELGPTESATIDVGLPSILRLATATAEAIVPLTVVP